MLLGFKGRYAVYEQEKLLSTLQQTANALVKVGKIRPVDLAPNWLSADQPKAPAKRGMPVWAKIGALAFVGLAVVVYMLMFLLSSQLLEDAVKPLAL